MRRKNQQLGFSLLQLSVIIAAAGMIAAASLPTQQGDDVNAKYIETKRRMVAIEEATNKMMASWGRRPCPASGTYALGTANFGTEDGSTRGDCITRNSATGVIAPFNDANVVAGTVPVRKLQLPDEYAFDAWGRPFTYVVDKRATEKASCVDKTFTRGAVTVNNMGTTESVMTALISHGPDGHGAFPPQGAARTSRFNAGSTDTDQARNAGGSNFAATPYTNNFIKKERTATFDDLLWYGDRYKNTCCLGKVCKDVVGGGGGTEVAVIEGTDTAQWLGTLLKTGDIDNDGRDDFIIGNLYNGSKGNELYIFYGSAPITGPTTVNSSNGTIITTTNPIKSIAIGNLNSSGGKDIVMSGDDWAAVLFGSTSRLPANVTVSAAAMDGTNGFYITFTDRTYGTFGQYVSVSDLDNDSRDDILISQYDRYAAGPPANDFEARGVVNIVMGRASWSANYSSGTIVFGADGFTRIIGDSTMLDNGQNYTNLGFRTLAANLNNDFNREIIISTGTEPGFYDQSASVVIYGNGNPMGWGTGIAMSSLLGDSSKSVTLWDGLEAIVIDTANTSTPMGDTVWFKSSYVSRIFASIHTDTLAASYGVTNRVLSAPGSAFSNTIQAGVNHSGSFSPWAAKLADIDHDSNLDAIVSFTDAVGIAYVYVCEVATNCYNAGNANIDGREDYTFFSTDRPYFGNAIEYANSFSGANTGALAIADYAYDLNGAVYNSGRVYLLFNSLTNPLLSSPSSYDFTGGVLPGGGGGGGGAVIEPY